MSGPHDRLGTAVLRALTNLPPSDPMGEMAREVLSGRMTLPQAMHSAAYSESFAVASQEAVRKLGTLTPEEIRTAEDLGPGGVADLLDPPPPPKPAPRRTPVEDDLDESFTSPWDTRSF